MDRSTDLAWRKSSYSGTGQENCVEVAPTDGGMAVRDSKNPTGGVLQFAPSEWAAFIAGMKNGQVG